MERSGADWAKPNLIETQHLVGLYQSAQLGIEDFIFRLSGVKTDVMVACEWGHCRYVRILALFRTLQHLDECGLDPLGVMGWGATVELVSGSQSFEEVRDKLSIDIVDEITDKTDGWGENPANDMEQLRESIDNLHDAQSLDVVFYELRGLAHSLDTATALVSMKTFNTDFSEYNAPQIGEVMQARDVVIALRCYLLCHVGTIVDPDLAFSDFDA